MFRPLAFVRDAYLSLHVSARVVVISALLVIVASTALVIGIVFVHLQKQANELTILRMQLDTLGFDHKLQLDAANKRMQSIEYTVYLGPEKAVPTRQPSYVEVWQRNRDAELRTRLTQNERRIMQVDAELDRLRNQFLSQSLKAK